MDASTNPLVMEPLESLNSALKNYSVTLIVVSCNRKYVFSLVTRIVEMTSDGIIGSRVRRGRSTQ